MVKSIPIILADGADYCDVYFKLNKPARASSLNVKFYDQTGNQLKFKHSYTIMKHPVNRNQDVNPSLAQIMSAYIQADEEIVTEINLFLNVRRSLFEKINKSEQLIETVIIEII